MSFNINHLAEWHIVCHNDILGTIVVTSPQGNVAVVTKMSNNPGCVLYELLEDILRTKD